MAVSQWHLRDWKQSAQSSRDVGSRRGPDGQRSERPGRICLADQQVRARGRCRHGELDTKETGLKEANVFVGQGTHCRGLERKVGQLSMLASPKRPGSTKSPGLLLSMDLNF